MSKKAQKQTMTIAAIQVFVYGTLKPGEAYHQHLCAGYDVNYIPAMAQGRLYTLPVGYPAMTWGTDWVRGVLLQFASPALLAALDQLEDYQGDRLPQDNEYQRQRCPIYTLEQRPLTTAWVYLMEPERVEQMSGEYLATGYWSGGANR